MAKKGEHLSAETRRKLSEKLKGNKRLLGYKHTEESKKKIQGALKGRQRPASALRGILGFWKGRKHTEESKAKIRKNGAGRANLIAYNVSEEHRKKSSANMKALNEREGFRERARQRVVDRRRKGQQETGIERKVREHLTECGIEFRQEHIIDKLCVDFYLPQQNVVLECDGEYWHGTEEAQRLDARRDAWLAGKGIRVIRFKETTINKRFGDVVRKINFIVGGGCGNGRKA